MSYSHANPFGYRWRSSKSFILFCVTLALFSENFLYSFIVPILQVMLEDRLHIDPSQTQTTTSALLAAHAFVCFASGPLIGHWADIIPSRKGPLLASLGGAIVGTIIIAAATSLPVLVFGRIIQGVAGNAAWIVGFATVADTVGADTIAQTIATVSGFFMSGLLVGPMTSGALLQLVGYWPTWLTAIAILAIDMAMRVVMIERPKRDIKGKKKAEPTEDCEASGPGPVADETSSLLPAPKLSEEPPPQGFYKIILSNPRALTAMACHGMNAIILASFDTTLPMHVTRCFGWNTFDTSLMFLILQIPMLFLCPFTGIMKDRMGTKILTGVGFLATAFLLCILGIPGTDDGLSFAGSGKRAQNAYMAALLGVGVIRTLVSGCGILEMTVLIKELQAAQHGIFGPNGGLSRGYSLTNMSWTFGLLVGPILTGSLTQIVGYYYMNLSLALTCSVCAIFCLIYLHKK